MNVTENGNQAPFAIDVADVVPYRAIVATPPVVIFNNQRLTDEPCAT